MKLKLFILTILIGVFLIQGVSALQLLQPITSDLTNTNVVDVGNVSSGGSFLVSFLLQPGDDFNEITVVKSQTKDVVIENTKNTQESIFTTIKLNENLSGNYTLNLLLKGNKTRLVKLNLFITNKVIYTILQPIEKQAEYNKPYKIKIDVINKSQTTKQIEITSDLPKFWFNRDIKKTKIYNLQPNSMQTIDYELIPQTIGKQNFNIYILTDVYNQKKKPKYIVYNIDVTVNKSLEGIYGSYNHVFPLFYTDFLPIYFLNKIINLF